MKNSFVEVVFPVAAPHRYTYQVPGELSAQIHVGTRVFAELQHRKIWGFVCRVLDKTDIASPKPVLKAGPFRLAPQMMQFLLWLSDYYCASPGDVLRTAFSRRIEHYLDRHEELPAAGPGPGPAEIRLPSDLTAEQAAAFDAIAGLLQEKRHGAFLLHGVTGSGKSHVYYAAAQTALRQGRGVMLLVPEISLTPQTVRNFNDIFGSRVSVFHSRLSEKARVKNWLDIYTGRTPLVIGVRSALFTPVRNLGLIIVDEEHDASYYQSEKNFSYNARDAALMRAKIEGAAVVLGSATPSIETRYNADQGKYRLLALDTRYNRMPLPAVHRVDMRQERAQKNWSAFSGLLMDKIADRLEKKEQVILLKNRRGYANFLQCRECGYIPACPHCAVTMTYHRTFQRMVCHYCDRREAPPAACPSCRGTRLKSAGAGVERVEEEIKAAFPQARVLRLDMDVSAKRGSLEEILDRFRQGRADVLIGTQMVSKGLDFARVTLVGVVLADTGLYLPDFRATERVFQLLTQVAGRAGRGERAGEVVLQTYSPDEKAILAAVDQDYRAFYDMELQNRRDLLFPPFARGALVRFLSKDEAACRRASQDFFRALGQTPGLACLGPAPAPLHKIRNHYRYFIYIKEKSSARLHAVLKGAFDSCGNRKRGKVKIQTCFDPDSLL
jgi:primosomal protein N' (replication factor Y)